jgi:opacity protein-like surface antigen
LNNQGIIYTLASIGFLVSAQAQATDDPFTGPSLAAGIGIRSVGSQIDTSTNTAALARKTSGISSTTISHASDTRASLQSLIDLSYGFATGKNWVTSVGMRYDPGKVNGGDTKLVIGSTDIAANLNLKNHLSVYVAPGRRLGEDWLLFGKLSYHQINAQHAMTLNGATSRYRAPGATSRLHGIGIGMGAKWALAKHLNLGVGIDFIRFDKFTHQDRGVKFYDNRTHMIQTDLQLGYHF